MLKEPQWLGVTTWVGSGVPRFYLPLDQIFPQTNVSAVHRAAQVAQGARGVLRKRLPALLASEFPEARAASSCCPTARRCRTRCSSASSGRTRRNCASWADQAKDPCCCQPQHAGVNDNWNERIKVLRLDIDQDKARALGVSSQEPGPGRAPSFSGSTIGQYREGDA
jgi:multidrug efflux pump